jgi:hypothetical protein
VPGKRQMRDMGLKILDLSAVHKSASINLNLKLINKKMRLIILISDYKHAGHKSDPDLACRPTGKIATSI